MILLSVEPHQKRRVKALRAAGAKEIHMRISCPPTKHPCFFGIDFPSKGELIANNYQLDEIKDFIGADSLAYLSMEGLLSAVDQPDKYCRGCFTGKYPMNVKGGHQKDVLEKRDTLLV